MVDSLEARIKQYARELGFALVGIAPATDADGFARFCDWLDAGYAGEMKYLHKYREQRRHPRGVVKSVRSVIMLSLEYGGTAGNIAKYAQGPDYHEFIWEKLNTFRDWLMAEVPGSYAHGTTDSAPLLERDFARRAGLGWFGKNTMLINKQRGSYFFIAALLTSIELDTDPPHATSHCGTCTACLDACPTQAFPQPGTLDARRCISYLTIELRTPIPLELRAGIGSLLFGCDICQDVCPWNRFADASSAMIPHRDDLTTLNPIELLALTEAEFETRFAGTAILRTRREGLARNAAIVLGNMGDTSALAALEHATHDDSAIVREAASWAIEQIQLRK